MSLPTTLNTNEVKDSAGAEQEFQTIAVSDRKHVFAKIGESPAYPHRISVLHTESGSGMRLVRSGVVRIDKTVISSVDSITPVTITALCRLIAPIGALATNAEMINVLANLNSFVASKGATSTILFDGSGYGSAALLEGGI